MILFAVSVLSAGTLLALPVLRAHYQEGILAFPHCPDSLPYQTYSIRSSGFQSIISPPWGENQFVLRQGGNAKIDVTYVAKNGYNLIDEFVQGSHLDAFEAPTTQFYRVDSGRGEETIVFKNATGLGVHFERLSFTSSTTATATYILTATISAPSTTYVLPVPIWGGGCTETSSYLTVGTRLYSGPLPIGSSQYSILHVIATSIVPIFQGSDESILFVLLASFVLAEMVLCADFVRSLYDLRMCVVLAVFLAALTTFGALTAGLTVTTWAYPILQEHVHEGNDAICSGGKGIPNLSISIGGSGFSSSITPPWGEYQFVLKPGSIGQIVVRYTGDLNSFPITPRDISYSLETYTYNQVDPQSGELRIVPSNNTGLTVSLSGLVVESTYFAKAIYLINADASAKAETYLLAAPFPGECGLGIGTGLSYGSGLYLTVGNSLYSGPLPYGKARYSLWHVADLQYYPFILANESYFSLGWGLSLGLTIWSGSILIRRKPEPQQGNPP